MFLQQLASDIFFTQKIYILRPNFKISGMFSTCTSSSRRGTNIFLIPGVNKINETIADSNKLTNNFAGLVTSSLGKDVARGPLL